jgi:hypothetical protein
MSRTHGPLSGSDVLVLADIVNACIEGKLVHWLADGSADIRKGVARHIVRDTEHFAFLVPGDDIRDGWLRITSGWDVLLPVTEVMAKMRDGSLAFESK